MRRIVCSLVATLSVGFVGCTSTEPTGPLNAALLSGNKTVVVSPSEATLSPGGTQQFSAQFFVSGMQRKAIFVWTSSNENVATVSSIGLVTAVAAGEATITATTSRTSGTAHVTVQEPPPAPPQIVATILMDDGPFGSAVAPNGTGWISQPGFGQISRLDIANATVTGAFSPGPFPVQIAANADGSRIYTVNFFGGQVSMINTATLAIENSVFISGEDVYGVTATPTGDTVFVGLTNGPIYKIDMRAGTFLGVLNLPVAAGYHFEWNKNRTRLYASQRAFDGGRVFEIEPNGFTLLRTFETGGSAQAIQLSADDSKLFVAAQDGGIIVWDVASNALITTYATPNCSGYGLLRTPNDAFLVVGCIFQGSVEVLDPNTGALIETLTVNGQPRELSWDPATRSVLVPNEFGWVDILR